MRARLIALVAVVALAAGVTAAVVSADRDRRPPGGLWPRLNHVAGVYSASDQASFPKLKALGITVVLGGPPPPATEQALRHDDMTWVDPTIQSLINNQYQASCHGRKGCTIPRPDEQRLEDAIAQHIRLVNRDPTMVGYYILDDSPGGDVTASLEAAHRLVREAAPSAPFARPTLCGFMNFVDSRSSVHDPHFTPDHWYFDNFAIVNFDPSACDLVMLYTYAGYLYTGTTNVTDANFDWSMKTLLPYEFSAMRAKGWDPAKEPLIGIPAAFGSTAVDLQAFYPPSAMGLATQIKAFCDAGAVAILGFAWHDGARDPTYVFLSQSPALQEGMRDGITACRQTWSATSPRPG